MFPLLLTAAFAADIPASVAHTRIAAMPADQAHRTRLHALNDLDGDGLPELMLNGGEVLPCGNLQCPQSLVDIYSGPRGRVTAPTWWLRPHQDGGTVGLAGTVMDVNCDTQPDLLISDLGNGTRAGSISVWFGPVAPGELDIGTADVSITDSTSGLLGLSLLPVPDLDGDGCDELATSRQAGAFADRGSVFLLTQLQQLSGSVEITDTTHVRWDASLSLSDLSNDLELLDDLDGDGAPELVASAPRSNRASLHAQGEVFIIGGLADAVAHAPVALDLASESRRIVGQDLQTRSTGLGWSLATGDVDDDGGQDLVIGAPFTQGGGSVYVIPREAIASIAPGDRRIVDRIARRVAAPSTGTYFGWVVEAGDIDGDGIVDMMASDPGDLRLQGAGAVWFHRGPLRSGVNQTVPAAPTSQVHAVTGIDHFGYGLTLLPDIDGDGLPDPAVAWAASASQLLGASVF